MAGRQRSILALCLLASCIVPPSLAIASETITYVYDTRGRLVKVARSGAVNDGAEACYAYDKADNRSNVTVVGAGASDLTVNDVSATEGTPLTFVVTRCGSTGSSVSVSYATSNGTATAGSDYTANSGTLTFVAGDATETISVTTTDDGAVESAETINLTLSGATGGTTISDAQAIGTINDNDTAGPSFAINDVSVSEGGSLSFTVTKTGSTSSSHSVTYATASGTAISGTDFTAASGTLTFTAAETSKPVSIQTTEESTIEPNETVLVNLTNATGGASISDAQGVGTINNDDSSNPPPVANPDSITLPKCRNGSIDVIANDTDPNTPLELTAVDANWAWVASTTTVGIFSPDANGTYVAHYTVRDSLGATSTGTLTLTVSGSQQCVF
jgi:hypothetical protein